MTLVRPDMIYFNGIDNFLPSKSLLVKSPCKYHATNMKKTIEYPLATIPKHEKTLIHF